MFYSNYRGSSQMLWMKKILWNLEYHSVCPLVRIGTPTPAPASEWAPHLNQGEGNSPAGEGVGGPNSDDWRKA